VIVSREVAATTPPSRPPRSWNGEGEVFGVVPLLRAEGSEEESQGLRGGPGLNAFLAYFNILGLTFCIDSTRDRGHKSPRGILVCLVLVKVPRNFI